MTPKSKESNKQLELEYKFKTKRLDVIGSTIHALIRWGSLAIIAFIVFGGLGQFAGQYTSANVIISLFGELNISEALAYIFGAGGVGYGMQQRQLRRKNIERLAERPRQLEKVIDAQRSSSGLRADGTTRPEDTL